MISNSKTCLCLVMESQGLEVRQLEAAMFPEVGPSHQVDQMEELALMEEEVGRDRTITSSLWKFRNVLSK